MFAALILAIIVLAGPPVSDEVSGN
jgi:hypothetical protein